MSADPGDALQAFAALTRAFLQRVDGAAGAALAPFVDGIAADLARLYAAGLGLPAAPAVDDPPEYAVASPREALAALFGEHDAYASLFDPGEPVAEGRGDLAEVVRGSLSTDLAEACLVLGRSLASYDAGQPADAAWEWRFEMRGHLGSRLTALLHALQALSRFRLDAPEAEAEAGAGPAAPGP